jgi:hypothetical protein
MNAKDGISVAQNTLLHFYKDIGKEGLVFEPHFSIF